jgi:hypothetical protein
MAWNLDEQPDPYRPVSRPVNTHDVYNGLQYEPNPHDLPGAVERMEDDYANRNFWNERRL